MKLRAVRLVWGEKSWTGVCSHARPENRVDAPANMIGNTAQRLKFTANKCWECDFSFIGTFGSHPEAPKSRADLSKIVRITVGGDVSGRVVGSGIETFGRRLLRQATRRKRTDTPSIAVLTADTNANPKGRNLHQRKD